MAYNGIKPETLFLAAQNKFENSRIFYEEHKQELKEGFTIPMRQIAAQIAPQLYELDDKVMTDPVKMVSRFFRDTRFSKYKHLYRDNLWIMFMRNKHEWQQYPCMWFEVTQNYWSYGVGMFWVDATYLELYRKALIERPQEFLKAVKDAEKTGAMYSPEFYKKPKPGDPIPEIEPYYHIKNLHFIAQRTDFETLAKEELIDELKEVYKNFSGMYSFLKSVADERTML
ncbi:MAG: DUF2461 domain-containing protein [Clostridia bacterium]|nr:DUF2461 domain-containing protein [Clostridia bacterium]